MWGLGILRVRDESEAKAFGEQDPTIRSGLGFSFEVYAMPKAIVAG